VLDTSVEGTFRMMDHDAELVVVRTIDAGQLPRDCLPASLLELESDEGAARLRDEFFLG
jgi:hypothetical protein